MPDLRAVGRGASTAETMLGAVPQRIDTIVLLPPVPTARIAAQPTASERVGSDDGNECAIQRAPPGGLAEVA
jgi:hypothetical protein